MRKFFLFSISVLMIAFLCACNQKEESGVPSQTSSVTQSVATNDEVDSTLVDSDVEEKICSELSKISEPYSVGDGIIAEKNVDKFKADMEKYLKEQVDNNVIKSYEFNHSQVTIITNDNEDFTFAYFIENLN